MKPFLDKNFLLDNQSAVQLYHEHVCSLPIIDTCSPFTAQEIAENKPFESVTHAWFRDDYYKERIMRRFGIGELTEKMNAWLTFERWADILPMCIGNPVYHWTHLELQRFFDIQKPFNSENSKEIWNICNETLQDPSCTVQNIIHKHNVELICTIDNPYDDLQWHDKIESTSDFAARVLPTFQADMLLNVESEYFARDVKRLSKATDINIHNWVTLKEAIAKQVDFFHEKGCRLSEHRLSSIPQFVLGTGSVKDTLKAALKHEKMNSQGIANYQFELLKYLASLYKEKGWVMQLHLGVRPHIKLSSSGLGGDFDIISDDPVVFLFISLLRSMRENNGLPKIVVYNLNPNQNFVLASILRDFEVSDSLDRNEIQFGFGGWATNQEDEVTQQLINLGHLGSLGRCAGILTDSPSFLSYPQHEYFRRVLCNLLGSWVEKGHYPADHIGLKKILQGIIYHNVEHFLNS